MSTAEVVAKLEEAVGLIYSDPNKSFEEKNLLCTACGSYFATEACIKNTEINTLEYTTRKKIKTDLNIGDDKMDLMLRSGVRYVNNFGRDVKVHIGDANDFLNSKAKSHVVPNI